jgi:hypothetical protein
MSVYRLVSKWVALQEVSNKEARCDVVAKEGLVPYDAVNHNKVSIRQLHLFLFSFSLTTCFGPYGPSSGEIYN